ncbi:MAG: Lrp/AsnC family transcriptional regulator [Erysipelotrichaceae bacterium]|jgi:DNA-binding Lrp family transcriptional regulator|nr:Lrp/AsnC family transcriptional regulator [Erysipelotrichaceae bacterium]
MEKILSLLRNNARLSNRELAVLLGITEEEAAAKVKALEKEGIIKGYLTVCNESKIENAPVHAMIELKVVPMKELGFQDIANRVVALEAVDSVYLMAGDYDLAVFVKGKTMQEVATFVAKRLATLDSVLSTNTHFILNKYKEDGIILEDGSTQDIRSTLKSE